MSVTIAFQDYMAGWDLAREVLKDGGVECAESLKFNIRSKSVDDDITMGLRECVETAIAINAIPMSSVELFA